MSEPSGQAHLAEALRQCASEPIHRLGLIQPHGVLLAMDDADFRITHVSGNLGALLDREPGTLLGTPLADWLGAARVAALRATPGIGDWRNEAIIDLAVPGPLGTRVHDARLSRNGRHWLLEIELDDTRDTDLFQGLFIPIRDALWQLDAVHDLALYTQRVAQQVRLLTGFDRVMMYRFDANWDGEVIAESKADGQESYLGNRFPASDIPPQARELYTRNLIRLIADVEAVPVPLLAATGTEHESLDLSYSGLRHFSPVHLEYLRNMGVRASMSISLIRNNRLWGLIACHHGQPRVLPFRIQELDEFIGKTVSLKLSNIADQEKIEFNERIRDLLNNLTWRIRSSDNIDEAVHQYQQELLGLVRATGVVISLAGRRHHFGESLPEAAISDIEHWLRGFPETAVFQTDDLQSLYAPAHDFVEDICGLMVAPLNARMSDYIMWFRPSTLRRFRWAGRPEKVIVDADGRSRISPRTSFATWIETYRDRCAPWLDIEIDAANALSLSIIEVLTQRALRQSEANYRLLAEHSIDLIARIDARGHFTYASPASEDMLGIPPEQLLGEPIGHYVHPDDAGKLMETLRALPAQSSPRTLLLRFLRQDGRLVWIEATLNHVRDLFDEGDETVINARDVTQRHTYQLAIEDLHRRNRLIMESAGEGLVSLNRLGRISFANEQASKLLGQTQDHLLGSDACASLGPVEGSDASAEACPWTAVIEGRSGQISRQTLFRQRDGSAIPVHYICTPLIDNGSINGAVVVFSEITEHQRVNALLKTREAILDETMEAVMVADDAGRITSVNRAFTVITGYEAHEAIGETTRLLKSGVHTPTFYATMWAALHNERRWVGEIWNRRKNGEIYPQLGSITAICDEQGRISNYVAVFSDISKAKQAEEKLFYLANHDTLTGLSNRVHFTERIGNAIARMKRKQGRLALLFIDLDHFKIVNDTLGHSTGDVYLKHIASRLRLVTREEESLSRWGGDEFILLVEDIQNDADIGLTLERMLAELSRPMNIEGHELTPSASVGIALYPDNALNAADLIKCADTAMYRAKQRGRNSYEYYSEYLADAIRQRFEIGNALQRAIRNDELRLYYQVQVDARDQSMVGLEALVRWQHPERGLLAPASFVPLAEELGLIELLGDWVLREACRQTAGWLAAGLDCPPVAVNVSPVQFTPDFPEVLDAVLRQHALPARYIDLEITESALEKKTDIIPTLQRLKALGVTLSVDDFGTGYSSLSHLKEFPIDCFKIDKSFVDGIPDNAQDTAIARTILALGESLGVIVLAEGVESDAQFRFLRGLGVHRVQGYLFGMPVPADAIAAALRVR